MLPTVVESYLTRTVLLENIALDTNHRQIREFFETPIMCIVRVPDERDASKQVALVVFEKQNDATRSVEEYSGRVLGSSNVRVSCYRQS
jgi:hypothetical protein